jgi:putative ABC transport system permease protein
MPYPDSERLVALVRNGSREGDVSIPDAVDLRQDVKSASNVAFFWPGWAVDLVGDGDPVRLTAGVAEPEYFDVLGSEPLVGRRYTQADGDTRVAVLSEGLWRQRFGADRSVAGRTITLSGNPYTIVGVMPAEFGTLDPTAELWLPPAAETPWALSQRGSNGFEAIARLAPGATLLQANQEFETVTARLSKLYPETNGSKVLTAVPVRRFMGEPARPALLALWAAVGLLLVITCANLASLLLARGVTREGEFAVRLALGAKPNDLLRSVLLEGLLLAMAGGAIGFGLASWGMDIVRSITAQTLPRSAELRLDTMSLGVGVLVASITSLLFGAVPAVRAARTAPASSLGTARSGPGRAAHRFLAAAVIGESALATVLLVACLLLARTFSALTHVDMGFVPDQVLSAQIVLPELKYGYPNMQAQTRAFTQLVERVNAIPGVISASTVISAPLTGGGIGHTVVIEGAPTPEPGHEPGARSRPVVGDYFSTMRLAILRGRPFSPTDDARATPVAIVNEAFAARHWAGLDPIGRRLALRLDSDSLHWLTVVGVARDVRSNGPLTGDDAAVYTPYVQREAGWQRFGTLMVRSKSDIKPLVHQVEQALWSVDPTIPLAQVHTMPELLHLATATERLSAVIAAALAVAAILIAAQGIVSVLSFLVRVRRRELAVRMALGADAPSVVRLVARRGLALAGTGLTIGIVVAFGLARLIRSLLFGVGPGDWPSHLLAGVALLGVALIASLIPGYRASRLDPMLVLKGDA